MRRKFTKIEAKWLLTLNERIAWLENKINQLEQAPTDPIFSGFIYKQRDLNSYRDLLGINLKLLRFIDRKTTAIKQ